MTDTPAPIKVRVPSATIPKKTSLTAQLRHFSFRAKAQRILILMMMARTRMGNAALVSLIVVWVHSALHPLGSLNKRERGS